MNAIVDAHSIVASKTSGFERFARAVLPELGKRSGCRLFSAGSGKAARALNFVPIFSPFGSKVLFPTNPPLFWSRSRLKKAVFIVHDIFPLISPELCQRATARIYRRFLEDVLEKGTVLSVSTFTSLEIGRFFSIAPVPVVGNYIETKPSLSATFDLRERMRSMYGNFILAVGTIEPRKNYTYLLDEFHQYRSNSSKPLSLVIFGRKGWKSDSTVEAILSAKGVYWIPESSDAMLWAAYREAKFLVSASKYEGFNMPVFESVAVGTPAILPTGSAPTFESDGFITYDLVPGMLAKLLMDLQGKVDVENDPEFIKGMAKFDVSKYSASAVSENIIKFLEG